MRGVNPKKEKKKKKKKGVANKHRESLAASIV